MAGVRTVCRENKISPVHISQDDMARFFIYLCNEEAPYSRIVTVSLQ